MKHKLYHHFITVLGLFLIYQPAQCSADDKTILPPENLSEIRQEIEEIKVSEDLPSLAVGVAQDGQIIWQEGFGRADRENRRDATPHTMYSTASISKPFTATAIMMLAEEGKIDLDAPANDYLSRASIHSPFYDADDVTVRMLLNHTGGLPLHYQFFYEDDDYKRPSMTESIRRYGIVVYEPGKHYQYANFGYGILDEIIANVSGVSYTDFLHREIFTPLGMDRSYVGIGPRQEEHHAIRYGPDQKPIPFYDFDHRGASAVYSSVHDLLRFGMFMTGNQADDQRKILNRENINRMKDFHDDNYGLGWILRDHDKGLREVYHTGSMGGVSTVLTTIPEENTVITVLANTRHPAPSQMAQQIVYELFPDAADDPEADQNENPQREEDSLPEHLTGSWEGTIVTHEDSLSVEIEFREDDEVHLQIDEQPRTLLNNPGYSDDRLTGQFKSSIQTEDAERRPYVLYLNAVVQRDQITGAVTAISLPGDRLGNALSSFIHLTK